MRAGTNPQKAPQKQKYLKSQLFSLQSGGTSNNHCRSLVDLNNIDTSSQKENKNIDHFASVNSNHPNVSQVYDKNSAAKNGISNNKNYGKPNVGLKDKDNSVVGNVSNIAKILMQASKNKNITDNRSNNHSSNKITNNPHTTNMGTKKTDLLADIVNNRYKKQARTSSQTNLREPTNLSTSKQSTTKQSLFQQKSQKNLKPQLSHSYLAQHSHSPVSAPPPPPPQDYALLVKLKQYIEQLKQNQYLNLQKIQKLNEKNCQLQQEIVLLKDKIQVLAIREKQMVRKIRGFENFGKDNKKGNCEEHLLIIQSLKNIINQQMGKIIQMEAYRIQSTQSKKPNNNTNKAHENQYQNTMQSQKQKDSRFHEVYSFKKRSNLNQSSIYIEDEEEHEHQNEHSYPEPAYKITGTRAQNPLTPPMPPVPPGPSVPSKCKKSLQNIPQPYNQLLKCLKSDSRTQPHKESPKQNGSKISLNSSLRSQSEDSQVVHHQYSNYRNHNKVSQSKGYREGHQGQRHGERQRQNGNEQQEQEGYDYQHRYRRNQDIYEDDDDQGHKNYQVYEEEDSSIDRPSAKTNNKYQDQCSEDEILMEVGNYLQNIRRNVRQN